MVGVWTDPVTAQVMMTFRLAAMAALLYAGDFMLFGLSYPDPDNAVNLLVS
jgi:hypothetical protein